MPRILAGLFLVGAILLCLPGLAHAQTGGTGGIGGTGGTTALSGEDFFIGVQGTEGVNLTEYQRGLYFNKANCDCEKPTWIFAALNTTGLAKRNTITGGNVQLWIGTSCEQPLLRATQCQQIGGTLLLTDFAARGGVSVPTSARVLSTRQTSSTGTGGSTGTVATCNETQKFTQTLFLLADQQADDNFELAPTLGLLIDLAPPPPPTAVGVRGGNEALIMNWTPVNTSAAEAADLLGYQVLCNRAGEFQVFPTGSYSPGYASKATQCPDASTQVGSVESLDPKFLCSGLLSAVATSHRIKVLQNFITYGATVIAIDRFGNPSAPDVFYGNPLASKDFYMTYRDGDNAFGSPLPDMPDPGGDNGGFCTVGGATERGFAAIPVLGLALAGVALARRRRRR